MYHTVRTQTGLATVVHVNAFEGCIRALPEIPENLRLSHQLTELGGRIVVTLCKMVKRRRSKVHIELKMLHVHALKYYCKQMLQNIDNETPKLNNL